MAAYDYSTTMTTTITPATATTSSLPIPADARSMIAGGVPEYAPPIPTKEQKESKDLSTPKEQINFSHGLLKDKITPKNTILPSNGYTIKREGMPTVRTSETFTDRRYYSKDRYKKREFLEKAIEIYNDPTATDFDEVLKTLPYKDEDKDVITHYFELCKCLLKCGKQPEDLLKSYQALGPEEDKDKLFWRMPCLEDILQGHTKDCYLLGALQATVNKDPTVILRMMRDNGNGTVTVRLFDKKGNPHYYIIEKTLCHGFAMNCMWVQMIERAYLIHRRHFPSDYEKTRTFENKREDLFLGFEDDTFSSMLGTPKNKLEIKSFLSKIRIILDKSNGLTTIGAKGDTTNWSCFVAHTYAILGYVKSPTGFYILVTEPHRGCGGKYEKIPGVNYNPCAKNLRMCKKCKGMEMMWLLLNNLLTPEELAYIISVLTSPPFRYLGEKERWYYEQQQRRKAVE